MAGFKCPHVDFIDVSPINGYTTQDGASVDLCADCTADLLDSLICNMSAEEFTAAYTRMREEPKRAWYNPTAPTK